MFLTGQSCAKYSQKGLVHTICVLLSELELESQENPNPFFSSLSCTGLWPSDSLPLFPVNQLDFGRQMGIGEKQSAKYSGSLRCLNLLLE